MRVLLRAAVVTLRGFCPFPSVALPMPVAP